jgi:hypothetical protein
MPVFAALIALVALLWTLLAWLQPRLSRLVRVR